jgi:hypothetical protein
MAGPHINPAIPMFVPGTCFPSSPPFRSQGGDSGSNTEPAMAGRVRVARRRMGRARIWGTVGSGVGVSEPIRCSGSSRFASRASLAFFRLRCSPRDLFQFRHSPRPARASRAWIMRSLSIAPARETGCRSWGRTLGNLTLDRRQRPGAHGHRRKSRPAAIPPSARSQRRVWHTSSGVASREQNSRRRSAWNFQASSAINGWQ